MEKRNLKKILKDVERILLLAKSVKQHLENNNIRLAQKELNKILNVDADEITRLHDTIEEGAAEQLLYECGIVLKDAKKAIQDLNSAELFDDAKRLVDEIIGLEGHGMIELSDEEKINDLLYDYWYTNIHSSFLYHGTTTIFEKVLRKKGMDPAWLPYQSKITEFLDVAVQYPTYLHNRLRYNVSNKLIRLQNQTYWSLNYHRVEGDFLKGRGQEGGEIISGINLTASDLLTANDRKEISLSPGEISFLREIVEWTKKLRSMAKPLLLKIRLSSSWLAEHTPDALWSTLRLTGSFEQAKQSLLENFRNGRLQWDVYSVNLYLQKYEKAFYHRKNENYEVIIKEQIPASEIIFEHPSFR